MTSQFSQQLVKNIGHQTALVPPQSLLPPPPPPPPPPHTSSSSSSSPPPLLQQQSSAGRRHSSVSPQPLPSAGNGNRSSPPPPSSAGGHATTGPQSLLSTAPSSIGGSPTAAAATVSTSTAAAAASAGGGATAAAPPRCCETGRPIFTDPITGQTVCSCQYDLLSYQRLAASGVPALSMYTAPYPEGMAAYFPALGSDQPPFYSAAAAGIDLKENLAAGATWPYHSVYHPYDAAFGYPFNGYGMDLNGARRKNATRETTSTLKAWLNEHKKNPYPTKGEKIMLAIITKMTLTQVSTWFANARRRLKKENKMTWEPRNRVEDEDNNNEDDRKSPDPKDLDCKDSGTGSSEDGDRPGANLTGSEWSESRADSGPDSPELFERPPPPHFLHHPPPYHHGHYPGAPHHPPPSHLNHHHHHHHHPVAGLPPPPHLRFASVSPPATGGGGAGTGLIPAQSSAPKPRIWSLADLASKDTVTTTCTTNDVEMTTSPTPPPQQQQQPPPSSHSQQRSPQHPQRQSSSSPSSGGGAVAAHRRPPAVPLPSLPAGYARHEQLYRSFYEDPAAVAYHAGRAFGGASIVFQPSAAHQHHLHHHQQQLQHSAAATAAEPSPASSTSDAESVVAVQHAERA